MIRRLCLPAAKSRSAKIRRVGLKPRATIAGMYSALRMRALPVLHSLVRPWMEVPERRSRGDSPACPGGLEVVVMPHKRLQHTDFPRWRDPKLRNLASRVGESARPRLPNTRPSPPCRRVGRQRDDSSASSSTARILSACSETPSLPQRDCLRDTHETFLSTGRFPSAMPLSVPPVTAPFTIDLVHSS
jgi:hypothetical protein